MASHLWNGDTISKVEAYLDAHFDALEDIVRAVNNTENQDEYLRRSGAIQLDGTGAGQAILTVPQGFDWLLQRITVASTGAGQCGIYENSVANVNLLETIASSQLYSDAFNNNVYVPAGSAVVVNFTAAGANGVATFNIQMKLIKRRAHTQAPLSPALTGDY